MKKNVVYRVWFKILLLCITFLPMITANKYDPKDTTKIISDVLSRPYINEIGDWMIAAKILLLVIAVIPYVLRKKSETFVLTYYVVMLLVMGVFQNMAKTDYGVTFITGNWISQYVVAGFCLYDIIKHRSAFHQREMDGRKLWIVPLMLLAYFMPYTMIDDIVKVNFKSILSNEAGVTYCMVTPVIEGIMLLFHKGIHKPTLHMISYIGLIFGALNMMTWFVADTKNWWMGVLHLPLVILSSYGLLISRRENTIGEY